MQHRCQGHQSRQGELSIRNTCRESADAAQVPRAAHQSWQGELSIRNTCRGSADAMQVPKVTHQSWQASQSTIYLSGFSGISQVQNLSPGAQRLYPGGKRSEVPE